MKSKTKKLFLTLFAFASLSLAACGGGNESSAAPSGGDSSSQSGSESSSEGSSSGESSSEEVDPNVVNAAKFAEVVTEYGCFGGSATYDAELASGTDEMDLKLEIQNGKIKQTETSGDEELSIYLEVKVNETTTETEIVRYYQSNNTWYKTPASEFIGFTYEYGEYGVAFDQLDFTDFEYNATTKKYALKQEVVLDYDDGDLVITYKSLSFKFENNNIVNVDATYEIGVDDPYEATLSITGSKFGSTTVTLPQAEDEPVGPTPPEPGPGPAVVVPPCIHLGRGSAWNDIQLNLKKEDADPDNPEYFREYTFEKNDVFKINFDGENEHWRGYSDLKPSSPAKDCFEETESDNNFKVLFSGTYTIYVVTNAPGEGTDAGKYVYITGSPANPTITYVVNLNEAPAAAHTVYAHVWKEDGTLNPAKQQDVVATISGTYATFTVNVVGQYDRVVLAELKDDQTTLGDNWVNVLRQTTAAELVNEGNYSWSTEPVPIAAHTMRVFTTETNYPMIEKPATSEYYVANVHLEQDQVFKFKMSADDSDWRGFSDLKTTGEGSAHEDFVVDNGTSGTDDNLKCNVASGNYDFFIATDGSAASIFVRRTYDRSGWKVLVNEVEQDVTLSDIDHPTQIEKVGLTLSVGDKVIFKKGTSEQGFAQVKDGCLLSANTYFSEGTSNELVVKAEQAGTYDFYVDLSAAKGIWLVKEGAPAVKRSITIDAGSLKSTNLVYAWVWQGSNPGRWVEANTTTGVIQVNETDDHIIPVVCSSAPDSETTWDANSHVVAQGYDVKLPTYAPAEDLTLTYVTSPTGGDKSLFTWGTPITSGMVLVVNDVVYYACGAREESDTYFYQYPCTGVTLNVGDTVKVLQYNSESERHYYDKGIKDGCPVTGIVYDGDVHALKCTVSGTFDLYLKEAKDNPNFKEFWINNA